MANQEATVLSGELEISYARYASLKGALKLEKVGLKSRGGALRPKLAKEFGLSPRAPYDQYINHCICKMNELLAAKTKALNAINRAAAKQQ